MTLNPAKRLRIDTWVGSLEPGKHADFGLHLNWPRSSEDVKELDKLIRQAKRYVAAHSEPATAQPLDLRLESLAKVLDGTMPVVVEATSLDEIQSAVAFANQLCG